jgi:oligoribonuclease NrnB/cAMP/cGMP phosphodiesterase (DHH superfamily)
MDDELIDDANLSLVRKSRLPGEGFFVPDSFDEDLSDEYARAALSGAEAAVVADPDADGLACVALLRELYDAPVPADPAAAVPLEDDPDESAESTDALEEGSGSDGDEDPVAAIRESTTVALVPAGPSEIEDGLERVAAFGADGIDVYVCDLCPDEYEYVEADLADVLAKAGPVRWFDHHQWDPEVTEAVRATGVDLVVGESDEECTADVALRSLDHEFPDRLSQLAAVTRDHDLWIKEDERSDDLADFSYWIDAETYVEVVRAYGPDLPPAVERFVASRREEKDALIETAVDRAELKEVGPWTVGVTYGRCSQNEVAEALREKGADASVIVKPAGSASIRGSETFERAHEVARQVDGGGHPRAAGCKPDIYEDMLDLAHHWTTEGAVTRQVILEAFRSLDEE